MEKNNDIAKKSTNLDEMQQIYIETMEGIHTDCEGVDAIQFMQNLKIRYNIKSQK